ncbi:S8 family serine peptidase [Cyclobacterium roseum]|uniref:S8 family serine peptidase n=1 Tax=Cyclobacterium roseum TaxID=2666137 RepID=UPI0013915DC9|nr:S8 family serine peptidase [Cyclobacterium roseum]
MKESNTNTDNSFQKYEENKMVVILKDSLDDYDCECLREKINNEVKEQFKKEEKPEDEFAAFERDPSLSIENIELWKNIKPDIVGRVIRSHTGANRVREGDFVFNYKNGFHEETAPENKEYESLWVHAGQNTDPEEVLIAVLDTGVNREVIPEDYLWKMKIENPETNEFQYVRGVNFLVEEQNKDQNLYGKYEINDDHKGSHGTLVNAMIIEQFKAAGKSVKIMNLKTHNYNGEGNLFSMVCAIRFAEKHGAKIINASWGFYSNELDVLEPLKELITASLAKKGVVFVAAAGNASPLDDDIFLQNLNQKGGDARNLSDHHFFPAYFGFDLDENKKNIIVVTTLSREGESRSVSLKQNYSSKVVDLGIVADQSEGGLEKQVFKVPLKAKQNLLAKGNGQSNPLVFGSSFAAAKATGLIGANFKDIFLEESKVKTKHYLFQNEVAATLLSEDEQLIDKIIDGRYWENGAEIA